MLIDGSPFSAHTTLFNVCGEDGQDEVKIVIAFLKCDEFDPFQCKSSNKKGKKMLGWNCI